MVNRRVHYRQLPDADAKELDNNPVLWKLRDSWFESLETEGAIMDTNVNTDPGAEAIYEGHLVHVVKTNRSNALIEHDDGERLTVTLDKLEPGRRTTFWRCTRRARWRF